MKKVTLLVALLAIAATSIAQSKQNSDKVVILRDGETVKMLPADFQPHETYMVVQRHDVMAVVPYPSAGECARFAAELDGRCVSGAYIIQHRGERLF
ncbi:hypothetical protein [Paraburkholderia dipogonis]|uniref:hypothetical protein n=1 Tax=Paraburkholderia dipogonis TaxID=1211383 RepID=UPI0038B91AA7